VIGVGNYVIVSPSELGNYKIVDTIAEPSESSPHKTVAATTSANLCTLPVP
jgi:hypothetical protein